MADIIVSRRCDEPMRRSKERAEGRNKHTFKCNGKCRECFCCIERDNLGNEWHVNPKSGIRKRDML